MNSDKKRQHFPVFLQCARWFVPRTCRATVCSCMVKPVGHKTPCSLHGKINEYMINLIVLVKDQKLVCVGIILYPSPQVIYMKLDKTWLEQNVCFWLGISSLLCFMRFHAIMLCVRWLDEEYNRNYILWHKHERLLFANIQKLWLAYTFTSSVIRFLTCA